MKSARAIRNDFLEFFREYNHKIVKSAPVIPQKDPTLLFTNAGMNQFKGIFLNREKASYPRVADSQKCIRVSGKHNDLEEVGKDTYHHTFFEMLGNWSFGDYYKHSAICFAWELLTDLWQLPKERLWATVHHEDEEAAKAWKEQTDLDPARILRFGEKDNFWEMGETGPCGPCSEIHYYTGSDLKNQDSSRINADDPEYIELWNLVFIQYERDESGQLHPLPTKHVDTGAGLERIVAVLQQKKSNYDTDLFQPIIRQISQITGHNYQPEDGMPHRVIADHVRMLTMTIADGGMPSNDGRGYVIRRILRRAARFGRMLDMHTPFIYKLVDSVIDILGEVYPEIVERQEHVKKVIKVEEESFGETLDKGLEIFRGICEQAKKENQTHIPGKEAFKLYDTYGFPLDLTRLLAEEEGLTVDEAEFQRHMEKQRQRAKAQQTFQVDYAQEDKDWVVLTEGEDSEFVGYDQEETKATLRKYVVDGDEIHVVLDKTPFYAEAGGEVGDRGIITGPDFEMAVHNTIKYDQTIVHIGQMVKGTAPHDPEVIAKVDQADSNQIRANHTATHLLHAALKQVVGEHVNQAGSLVIPEKLRFDLTHYHKLTHNQLTQIEDIVNQKIRANIDLKIDYQDYETARSSGAMALFGEKYADQVRVVAVPEFSKELCGGKHVRRTGDIGLFKILSETSVAAGIRRIEAVTGPRALELVREQESIINELEKITHSAAADLVETVRQLRERIQTLEKELKQKEQQRWEQSIEEEVQREKQTIADINIITQYIENKDIDNLKEVGDLLREKDQSAVGLIYSHYEDKHYFVIVVGQQVLEKYHLKAGQLANQLGKALGSGGGGRPHMATTGTTQSLAEVDVPTLFYNIIKENLDRG